MSSDVFCELLHRRVTTLRILAQRVLVLIASGGALYTLGGVVYGFQRPDPWPRWFGFHEVFHTFTILAFVTHYVGISLATYSLR